MSFNLTAKSSERFSDELPLAENHPLSHNRDNDPETTSRSNGRSARTSNRVECLDGLRGIACIAVFNYHFFWPWTKSIMLGHGFLATVSLEPYRNWLSLPIICLLHRGRPMVAVFFAVSGYVLSRHIVRSIHDRNLESVYRSLSSSVFRRIFRLYIPPTISMLLVAILALTGAFPSEASVYTGVDSIYINGTYDIVRSGTCHSSNVSVTVDGLQEITRYLEISSPKHLGHNSTLSQEVCLSRVSWYLGPFELYKQMEPLEAWALELQKAKENTTFERVEAVIHAENRIEDYKTSILKDTGLISKSDVRAKNDAMLYWSEFGGTWEEHPMIPDNITHAITDFVRTYAEWANPFNCHNYHTRYDPHTYTMPIELRGSMFIYLFLLGTLGLRTIWRLSLAGVISVYSLLIGRWDMSIFLAATTMSDIDIWNSFHSSAAIIDYGIGKHVSKLRMSRRASSLVRWLVFVLALYLLSYPDVGAEYTPGFILLSRLAPRYYQPLGRWMFFESIGAVMLIPCILNSRHLRDLLESRVAQYLGKISFSIYLVHGPVLHSLGFWVMPRLFERFGRFGGYLVGWACLFSTTMYLAHWWYKKVDTWSTTVGRRIERQWSN